MANEISENSNNNIEKNIISKENRNDPILNFLNLINNDYKKLYIENIKLIEFLKENINYSILKEFDENTVINHNNLLQYNEVETIINSIKKAVVDIKDLLIIFDKFAKFVDYYLKNKNDSEKFRINKTGKIINLIKNCNNLNDKISSNLYKYVTYYEKKVFYLISEKLIKNNKNITEIKLYENNKQEQFQKNLNWIIKDKKIEGKNDFEKNSIIIRNISFSYKNEIVKWMWNKNLITLEELINYGFINKHKKNELEEKWNIQNKNLEKEDYILNFVIDYIRKLKDQPVKKYINKITKITNLIIDKIDFNTGKFINNKLDLSEIYLYKKDYKNEKYQKNINLIIVKENLNNNQNNYLKNSKIIRYLSFEYQIDLFLWLLKGKIITIEELINKGIFNKRKIKKYEQKILWEKEKMKLKKEDYIFNFILESLNNTRKYRNKISHLENLIISKHSANNLYSYLIKQENLMKNGISKNLLFKIKTNFSENEFIRKNKFTKKYYKKFLE